MQRIYDKELRIKGERFSTLDEMYRVCESRDFNQHYDEDYDAKGKREIRDGKKYTWEQTKDAVTMGSTEFDDDFKKILREVEADKVNVLSDVVRSKTRKDVVGSCCSVERAMSGHPKPFNRRVMSTRKQKAIGIMFNITCAWHVETEDRLRAGCVVMAVAEILEKMDYQVAITYTPFFSYCGSGSSMLSEVLIKDYKTRFNLRKMQFPMASRSVLFQLGCWWHHRTPECEKDFGYGEGTCVDYDSRRLDEAKKYAAKNKSVYLSNPMVIDDFKMDVGKVLDYVISEIGKMNS